MKTRRSALAVAFAGVMALAAVPAFAHDVLYPGTVLDVQADRLHVRTVDPESKAEVRLWFTVTKDTRVKRGDAVVSFADAKIARDERVVVVVNHDAETKGVATEVRLAARSPVRPE